MGKCQVWFNRTSYSTTIVTQKTEDDHDDEANLSEENYTHKFSEMPTVLRRAAQLFCNLLVFLEVLGNYTTSNHAIQHVDSTAAPRAHLL